MRSSTFEMKKCLEDLGLNEGGRVQQVVDAEILRLCEPYIPRDLAAGADGGTLIQSGIEHTVIGSGEIVWKTTYARYVYHGIVYVDPVTKRAGFLTEDGWKSRRGVTKISTDRQLQYQGAPMRGSFWVDRCMQQGGLKALEEAAQKEAGK